MRRSGSGSRARRYEPRRAVWASARPARAGLRGARCTGAGEGPPVCTRWFQEARPGAESRVKPRRSAAVERRKASALPLSPLPRKREGREDSARRIARCGSRWKRLSALRLPSLKGGAFLSVALSKTRMQMHRENGFACSPLPARGERSSEVRVRGPLRESELRSSSPAATPPHPSLSPRAGRGSAHPARTSG